MRQSYYNGGREYFANFDGFDYLGGNEILGVEKKFKEDFGDFKFMGFIDLILRDSNGNIIIVDHKSKKEIKTKKDRQHYARQPFLYSKYILSEYGKFPTKLVFNMFRSANLLEIPFTEAAYQEAVQWAKNKIAVIKNTTEWNPNPDPFFCNYLCDFRETCQYRPEVN